jgi:hypothetical protein
VKTLPRWPLYLIALPAAVAVWSGWVGLGTLCGFGLIHPLPGIWDAATVNTAITLPVGVEAYGAYAMGAWLSPGVPDSARKFAKWSAIGALGLGMLGQVAYHLLSAAHAARAPWPVVVLVSSLPVVVLGFGAALSHLLRVEPGHVSGTLPETVSGTVAVAVPGEGQQTGASASPPVTGLTAAGATQNAPARATAKASRARQPKAPGSDIEKRARRLLARQQGMSGAELGRALGASPRTGQRLLAKLTEDRQDAVAA